MKTIGSSIFIIMVIGVIVGLISSFIGLSYIKNSKTNTTVSHNNTVQQVTNR